MPDFEAKTGADTMRATAHLPGLAIEIVHRRSPDDEEEQISINLKATPSSEAFGRFIDGANPLALWAARPNTTIGATRWTSSPRA